MSGASNSDGSEGTARQDAARQDGALAAAFAALTAPGALLETVPYMQRGHSVPALRHAPPSLADYFAQFCTLHAEETFLVDGTTRLTFGEAHALAQSAACSLVARHGVRRGDRVGIAAGNSAGWVVAYMAVLIAGGCATLLNGWWTGAELAEAVDMTGCQLVLADANCAGRLAAIGADVALVAIGEGPPAQALAALLTGDAAELPELGGDDLAMIVFTSGSTARPLAAWSDHRAVVHAALNFLAQALAFMTVMTAEGDAPSGQPTALLTVPLFHVSGAVPVMLTSFALGRKLVIMPRWEPSEALRLIEAERVTYLFGVPTMHRELATHPDRHVRDLSSWRHMAAGGAPRPVGQAQATRDAFPRVWPLTGYGLTETNAVGAGTFNAGTLAKPGSTGPANRPLVEIAVLGADGEHLPTGTIGEIALRSICAFGGYWGDDAATCAAVTADGFVRSGDLGFLDSQGWLTLTGRAKDVVLRGGETIACAEIERALAAHPGVIEAAAFALPDPRLGEVPVAVIRGRPDPADLLAHLAERLAPFKRPVRIWSVDRALPRLGSEKIDRRALREHYARLLARDERSGLLHDERAAL
jgi:acyl-CoA synthetase (AMP-forming)/AMP-acid ligase II